MNWCIDGVVAHTGFLKTPFFDAGTRELVDSPQTLRPPLPGLVLSCDGVVWHHFFSADVSACLGLGSDRASASRALVTGPPAIALARRQPGHVGPQAFGAGQGPDVPICHRPDRTAVWTCGTPGFRRLSGARIGAAGCGVVLAVALRDVGCGGSI